MTITITGMDEVKDVLSVIAPREAGNLARAVVHNLARRIAKDAKERAPADEGDMKKGIQAVRKRARKGEPYVSDVLVKTKGKGDASLFYWRFVEYGTAHGRPEQPFIRPAADPIKANIEQEYRSAFGEQLEKALKRAAKRKAR